MKKILEKRGKGGPGAPASPDMGMNPPIPGLDTPNTGVMADPTMGGAMTPPGGTPVTPTNPSAAAPTDTPSLPSTLAPLPKLRSGVGKTLKPSRFSNIRSSARMTTKSPGALKGSLTKEKRASLKGSVRKSARTSGRSPAPMSSMKKLPSFSQ